MAASLTVGCSTPRPRATPACARMRPTRRVCARPRHTKHRPGTRCGARTRAGTPCKKAALSGKKDASFTVAEPGRRVANAMATTAMGARQRKRVSLAKGRELAFEHSCSSARPLGCSSSRGLQDRAATLRSSAAMTSNRIVPSFGLPANGVSIGRSSRAVPARTLTSAIYATFCLAKRVIRFKVVSPWG